MGKTAEAAFAKINLFLDVTSKRDDGFHDIKSVMHAVTLKDLLTVTETPSDSLSIEFEAGNAAAESLCPLGEKNLVVKAAKAFYAHYGKTAEVHINLVKNIPMAAGLGGGSSDAAATLRALNRLNGYPFSELRLAEIGAEIGSDVPFCVIGGTALCLGRGEKITKIQSKLALSLVIAGSEEHVSTPLAYAALDNMYGDFGGGLGTDTDGKYEKLILGLKGDLSVGAGLYNVFESAVLEGCPRAVWIKAQMLNLGAEASMMSGSGPSVFGIFKTDAEAQSAVRALSEQGITAFAVTSVE